MFALLIVSSNADVCGCQFYQLCCGYPSLACVSFGSDCPGSDDLTTEAKVGIVCGVVSILGTCLGIYCKCIKATKKIEEDQDQQVSIQIKHDV